MKGYAGHISRLIKCDGIKKSWFLLADFIRRLLPALKECDLLGPKIQNSANGRQDGKAYIEL
jgi:hypothetical protein